MKPAQFDSAVIRNQRRNRWRRRLNALRGREADFRALGQAERFEAVCERIQAFLDDDGLTTMRVVTCSACGEDFQAKRQCGFSHCEDHAALTPYEGAWFVSEPSPPPKNIRERIVGNVKPSGAPLTQMVLFEGAMCCPGQQDLF